MREGQKVSAGTLLAKTPREVVRHAGHHRRSAARHGNLRGPHAARARPSHGRGGRHRLRLGEKKRGKRSISIQPVDDKGKKIGEEREHQVPHGKHLRVHTGD